MTRRLHAYALAGLTLSALSTAGCSQSDITAPAVPPRDEVPEIITVDPCAEFAAPARLPELPDGCDDSNAKPAEV